MKYFILIIVLLSKATFSFSQKFNYPQIKKAANSLEGFIPGGWMVLDSAIGDLNKDKVDDIAFVLQHTDSIYLAKTKNGDYWYSDKDGNTNNIKIDENSEVVKTQPRILLIAFKNKITNQFILKEQNNMFIPDHDNPFMIDPYESDSLKISAGVLSMSFGVFMMMGSWGTSSYSYNFRYQSNEFVLIGATDYFVDRRSGECDKCSYNFLTHKKKCISGSIDNDIKSQKVKWKKIPSKKIVTVKTLQGPYDWQNLLDKY